MSPLNSNHTVFDGVVAPNTVINIDLVRPKIMYGMEELLNLRDVAKQPPPKMQDNPQLHMVARINLMPAFAATFMPIRTSIPDGRTAFQGRRHVQHANGHDSRAYPNKSSSREGAINQSKPRIQISIPREIKLREAENAWKPSVMKKNDVNHVNEDDAISDLLRGVRSILNKLTPQNFDVMLEHFKQLNVDTGDKLNPVIMMVFDKAVNEPNFSTGYAVLCQHLSKCCAKYDAEQLHFKRTLISKCQVEFEQNVANTKSIDMALQPLKEKLKQVPLTDINQINSIKANIIEEESNLRRRLVSTVRFIGELYKLDMLTTNIMNWCIQCLVDSGAEDKLECLCKLLTTIGKKMETKPVDESNRAELKRYLDLTEYFKQLQKIAERKVPKIKVSSRIRFMIMDLIDLRNNNWKTKNANDNGNQRN